MRTTRTHKVEDRCNHEDGHICERSVEEAGHAVMSAWQRVPFSKVYVNSNTRKGELGGSIEHTFYPDKARSDESYIRKHALISVAGAAAQRTVFSGKTPKENRHDMENVRFVYSFIKRKPPLKQLREDADEIFRSEGLRRAIRVIAMILEIERKITAQKVKAIVGTVPSPKRDKK